MASTGYDSNVASLTRMDCRKNRYRKKKSESRWDREKDGLMEPDLSAYCKQGRKNEGDPDVDCQLIFSIIRNPTFPERKEPRVLLLFSMIRPASETERQDGRQCGSMKTTNPFACPLRVLKNSSRISINFHRIILIELIFSSPPSSSLGRQDRQAMSGSMKLLSSLYSTTPLIL